MADTPLNVSLKVTGIDQAKADLQVFGATGKRSFSDISAEAQKLSANAATTNSAIRGVATSVRGMAAEFDPLTQAGFKLQTQLSKIDQAVRHNLVSMEQAQGLTAQLSRNFQALEMSAAKTAAAGDALAQRITQLQAKFDPASASAKRMAAEIAEVNEAARLGVTIIGGQQAAIDKITRSYDEGAMAADRAAAATRRFNDEARRAQADANASLAQGRASAGLAPRGTAGSARESAAVFEADFADTEAQLKRVGDAAEAAAKRFQSLTARFDPASVSAGQMAAEIADLNEAQRSGVNIAGGYEAALAGITRKYSENEQAAENAIVAQRNFIQGARDAQATANAAVSQRLATDFLIPKNTAGSARDSARVFEEAFAAEEKAAADAAKVSTKGYEDSLKAAADAAKEAAEQEEKLAAAAQKHRDTLFPLIKLYDEYQEKLAEISGLESSGHLSTPDAMARSAQVTQKYAKDLEDASGATAALKEEQKKLATEAERAAKEEKRLTDVAQQQRDKLDPLAKVTRAYHKEVEDINKTHAAGKLTDDERTKSLDRARVGHEQLTTAVQKATVNSRQMGYVLTNLSFQLNDIATGALSGQGAFQIMAQQGGQLVQIFGQGGGLGAVMGALGAQIASMITPMRLAGIGAGMLGGAFLVLLLRAQSNIEKVRELNALMERTGRISGVSTTSIAAEDARLRAMGINSAAAQQQRLAIQRSNIITAGSAPEIQTIGADIGVGMGIGAEAGVEKLIEVLKQGPEATIKFALAIDALDAETAGMLLRMTETGKALEAQQRALDATGAKWRNFASEGVSPGKRALDELAAAWNSMLSALSEITPIQGAAKAITDFLKNITDAISAVDAETKGRAQDQLIGGGMGVTAGAITGGVLGSLITPILGTAIGAAAGAALGGYFGTQVGTGVANQRYAPVPPPHPPQTRLPGGGTFAPLPPMGAVPFPTLRNPNTGLVEQRPDPTNLPPGWRLEPAPAGAFNQNNPYATSLTSGFWTPPGQAHVGMSTLNVPMYGGPAPGVLPSGAVPAPTPSGQTRNLQTDPAAIAEQDRQLRRQKEQNQELIQQEKEWNVVREAGIAKVQKRNEMLAAGATEAQAEAGAIEASNQVLRLHGIEIGKLNELTRMRIEGSQRIIEGFKVSEAAGYREMAQLQASIEAKEKGTNATERMNQILTESALSAIESGSKQVAAAIPQINALEDIAKATEGGAAAQQQAQRIAAAASKTQDAAAKADASRNPQLVALAQNLRKVAEAEEERKARTEANTRISEIINQQKDTIEQQRLQASLQGETSDKQKEMLDLLQMEQDIRNKFSSADKERIEAFKQQTRLLIESNKQLAEAQRLQARWEATISSIAQTIESELSGAVDKALSGEKAEAWGARMKRVLNSALSGLTTSLFIKPLLGTVAGGLGAPNTAQSLGSFGSMLGGAGSLFGGGGQTITGPSGNVVGTISGGGGMFGTIGSELGITGAGGIGSGGLGGIFAHTGQAGTITNAAGVASPLTGTVPGSVFGTTSLGSAVGGIGAGFGAGMLTNSLMGGNKTGGMAGSAVGSLAGMAIGSMVGMPFLGALLGGAGGGMFGGMFGNSRPSNASAGGTVDLASGRITSGFAGGNAQIDQDTRQVVTSVAAVTEALMSVSGKLEGNLLIQGGVNTGFTADSTLPGFTGRYELGKDPVRAAELIALALSQSVTGVSDTVRTVLDQTKSLEDIVGNLQFAQIYDSIKTAAEDAFSSVEDATRRAGPFELAMNTIETTFADITTKATQFGLALEPVNAALEEATRRLQEDFVGAIDMAFNEASGSGFLNQIQATFDQYAADVREAQEIGLTYEVAPQVHHDLGQVFTEQVQNILDTLTEAQLDEVIAEFGSLNAIIDDLAASTEGVVVVTEELVAAQERAAQLTQATDQIQAFIDALLATPSPSVSPEAALTESRTQFAEQLALAQGGDMDALLGITASADQLVRNIHTFFASSEAGQVEIAKVIEQLTALQHPGGVGTANPAVITNNLLASIDESTQSAASTASSGLVVGEATQTLIDRNLETANKQIDRNEELSAAAIKANFDAADAAITSNWENTDRLINQGNEFAEARVAYEKDHNLALIASNDAALIGTLAQMDTEHTALLADAALQTGDITKKHDEVTGFILDDAKTRTDQLLIQAQEDALTATKDAETASAAIIAQAVLDQEKATQDNVDMTTALVDEATLKHDALMEANGLANDKIIKTTEDKTEELLTGADANTKALGLVIGANATGIMEANAQNTKDIMKSLADLDTNQLIDSRITRQTIIDSVNTNVLYNSAFWQIWSVYLHDTIVNGAATVSGTVAAWGEAQVYATNNSASAIMNTDVAWSKYIGDSLWYVSGQEMTHSTNLANSQIQKAQDMGKWITDGIGWWTGTQMQNDNELASSIIRTDAQYGSSTTAAVYNAANSMISVDTELGNSTVKAVAKLEATNVSYFKDVMWWLEVVNRSSHDIGFVAEKQRNTMIQTLTWILNQLKLMALIGGGYYPEYSTGD